MKKGVSREPKIKLWECLDKDFHNQTADGHNRRQEVEVVCRELAF